MTQVFLLGGFSYPLALIALNKKGAHQLYIDL